MFKASFKHKLTSCKASIDTGYNIFSTTTLKTLLTFSDEELFGNNVGFGSRPPPLLLGLAITPILESSPINIDMRSPDDEYVVDAMAAAARSAVTFKKIIFYKSE